MSQHRRVVYENALYASKEAEQRFRETARRCFAAIEATAFEASPRRFDRIRRALHETQAALDIAERADAERMRSVAPNDARKTYFIVQLATQQSLDPPTRCCL